MNLNEARFKLLISEQDSNSSPDLQNEEEFCQERGSSETTQQKWDDIVENENDND